MLAGRSSNILQIKMSTDCGTFISRSWICRSSRLWKSCTLPTLYPRGTRSWTTTIGHTVIYYEYNNGSQLIWPMSNNPPDAPTMLNSNNFQSCNGSKTSISSLATSAWWTKYPIRSPSKPVELNSAYQHHDILIGAVSHHLRDTQSCQNFRFLLATFSIS